MTQQSNTPLSLLRVLIITSSLSSPFIISSCTAFTTQHRINSHFIHTPSSHHISNFNTLQKNDNAIRILQQPPPATTTTTTTSLYATQNKTPSSNTNQQESKLYTVITPQDTQLMPDNESLLQFSNTNPSSSSSTSSSSTSSSTTTTSSVQMLPATTPEGLAWRGVVVILCALWASNFAAAKLILQEPGVDTSLYALARFSIAALALLPGSIRSIVKNQSLDWDTAKGAAICGSWVAFGYLGQSIGLLTTSASKSCVICSMHCVFVAILAEALRVQRVNHLISTGVLDAEEEDKKNTSFNLLRLVPAAVAVLGVSIVELNGAEAPTIGDAISFAQPIGFGLGYFQLEQLMRKRPQAALPVSCIKLMVVAFASLGLFELSPLLHLSSDAAVVAASATATATAATTTTLPTLSIPDFTPILSSQTATAGILYTGLITTAAALWVESIAFQRVPAVDASIILTTEPLFAAGASAVTLGETFVMSDYVGASLIIGACVLAVLLEEEGEENEGEDAVLEGKS